MEIHYSDIAFYSIILIFICRNVYIEFKLLKAKSQISKAISEMKQYLNFNSYFNNYKFICWKDKYNNLKKTLSLSTKIYDFNSTNKFKGNLKIISSYFLNGRKIINQYNEDFVKKELKSKKKLFNSILDYPLNNKQREAILHDEDNNLIIAGAGTGKTSTLVAKAIYLIETGKCEPEEMLLLAFTKNAVQEMRERIKKKINKDINVKTFNSFGLDIISETLKIKPDLAFDNDNKLLNFIYKTLLDSLKQKNFRKLFINYILYFSIPYRSPHYFSNKKELNNYNKNHSMITLKGEQVKSIEEKQIANFFFRNKIEYIYEKEYEHKTGDRYYRQYKPDFYLPKYNIYIEHFGIDRYGNPPPFFERGYLKGIKYKRKIHKKFRTTLVETYSFEINEGILFDNLKEKLTIKGVTFQEMSDEEEKKILKKFQQEDLPLITELLRTFLNIFKSNDYTIEHIEKKARLMGDSKRSMAFIKIFNPIYTSYERFLSEGGKIDFNDMILQATNLIRNKQYISQFKYILIDEFQDMTIGRYNLIKEMLYQNPLVKLFCVGDDWQSIYRFTGSDLSLIVNFKKHFKLNQRKTKRIDLDITYRFNNKIEELTSEFIKKNKYQLQKELKTVKQIKEKAYEIYFKRSELNDERLIEILDEINDDFTLTKRKECKVFVIGRYSFSKPENFNSICKRYPNFKMQYLTAHASKGMEADYVIIENIQSGKYGFPTEIVDDPILELVLTEQDNYDYAEERRLFYVTLTRAKNKIYLISRIKRISSFIIEIANIKDCPKCSDGFLLPRFGKFGEFYGCSNYPDCKYTINEDDFKNKSEDKFEDNIEDEIIKDLGYYENVPF